MAKVKNATKVDAHWYPRFSYTASQVRLVTTDNIARKGRIPLLTASQLTLNREEWKGRCEETPGRGADGHDTGGVLGVCGNEECPDSLEEEEEAIEVSHEMSLVVLG